MRYTQADKMDIIHLIEHSYLSIRKRLDELRVARSTFYDWYRRYQAEDHVGLADKRPGAKTILEQDP